MFVSVYPITIVCSGTWYTLSMPVVSFIVSGCVSVGDVLLVRLFSFIMLSVYVFMFCMSCIALCFCVSGQFWKYSVFGVWFVVQLSMYVMFCCVV